MALEALLQGRGGSHIGVEGLGIAGAVVKNFRDVNDAGSFTRKGNLHQKLQRSDGYISIAEGMAGGQNHITAQPPAMGKTRICQKKIKVPGRFKNWCKTVPFLINQVLIGIHHPGLGMEAEGMAKAPQGMGGKGISHREQQ
jgi:hypothetical protein